MMHTIRRIDAYSTGKTFGTIYATLFAILGLLRLFAFAFLDSLPTFPIYYSTGAPEEMTIGVAVINYLLAIIINFAGAWFTGVIVALLYNLLAPRIGGLQVQIDV